MFSELFIDKEHKFDSFTESEEIDSLINHVYAQMKFIYDYSSRNDPSTTNPIEPFEKWIDKYHNKSEKDCIVATLDFLKQYLDSFHEIIITNNLMQELNNEEIPSPNSIFSTRSVNNALACLFDFWRYKNKFIQKNNSQETYVLLTKTATRIATIAEKNLDFDSIDHLNPFLDCLEEQSEEKRRPLLHAITEERKKGNPEVIDRIAASLENNFRHLPFHVFQTERYVSETLKLVNESVLPLAKKGYEPQVSAAIDLMTNLTGSSILTLAQTFKQGLKRAEKLGELDFFTHYLSHALPLAGHRFADNHLSNLRRLTDSIAAYQSLGLQEKLRPNLNKIGVLNHPKLAKNTFTLVQLNYFIQYPVLVNNLTQDTTERIGETLDKLIEINTETKDKLHRATVPQWYLASMIYHSKKCPDKLKAIIDCDEKREFLFDCLAHLSNNEDLDKNISDFFAGTISKTLRRMIPLLPEVENVAIFRDYLDLIADDRLFDQLSANTSFLDSDTPFEEKHKVLEHLSVVKHVKDLCKIQNPNEWYARVTQRLGFNSTNQTVNWLDSVRSLKIFDRTFFAINLPDMLDTGVDLEKAVELARPIIYEGFHLYTGQIKSIINSDLDQSKKEKILKKLGNTLKQDKSKLAALAVDTPHDLKGWAMRANERAENFLEREFGTALRYSPEVNKRMAHLCRIKEDLAVVEQICRAEEQNEHKLIFIPPGKEYGREYISELRTPAPYIDTTLALVYGLISRDSEKRSSANTIFDPITIRTARQYVSQHSTSPRKLYSLIKSTFQILNDEKQEYFKRKTAAEEIINLIRANYVSNQSYSPEKHALKNLITSVEICAQHEEEYNSKVNIPEIIKPHMKPPDIFDQIACINQQCTIQDLFEGNRLFACTFLSEDKEDEETAGLYYHADYHIALQHLVPFNEGKPAGLPIGVSILVDCETNNNQSVLLIDSAEGGELLQRVPETIYLPLFLKGIIKAAQDANSDYILVPEIAVNTMAKRFRNFFKKTTNQTKPEKMFLQKKNRVQLFDIPQRPRYLESFQDQKKLSEEIIGYIHTTQELHEIYLDKFE